ncbi:MAG TPA: alpha/beta hydrolase [Methylobacterium sp.]|nr:alpha/beta hydrolase [Methylobacterium sp.]
MPSLKSRILALLLRLSNRRKYFASPDLDPERVVAERGGEARPTRAMRQRLQVDWALHDGCEVYTVAPRGRPPGPVILYLHGGAYIHPTSTHHWRFIDRMAERLGATFVVPFYPLAPGHDCLQVSLFVLSVYRDLLDRHGPSALYVMGDSAGGGLALALAMRAAAEGLPRAAGLVLLSPWLDVTMTEPSQAEIEPKDVMLRRPGVATAGRWYAGGLPPILMFCGTHDILVADARRLADRARRAGLNLTYEEAPGLMHVYAILPLPEARAAQARIERFIREDGQATLGPDSQA